MGFFHGSTSFVKTVPTHFHGKGWDRLYEVWEMYGDRMGVIRGNFYDV